MSSFVQTTIAVSAALALHGCSSSDDNTNKCTPMDNKTCSADPDCMWQEKKNATCVRNLERLATIGKPTCSIFGGDYGYQCKSRCSGKKMSTLQWKDGKSFAPGDGPGYFLQFDKDKFAVEPDMVGVLCKGTAFINSTNPNMVEVTISANDARSDRCTLTAGQSFDMPADDFNKINFIKASQFGDADGQCADACSIDNNAKCVEPPQLCSDVKKSDECGKVEGPDKALQCGWVEKSGEVAAHCAATKNTCANTYQVNDVKCVDTNWCKATDPTKDKESCNPNTLPKCAVLQLKAAANSSKVGANSTEASSKCGYQVAGTAEDTIADDLFTDTLCKYIPASADAHCVLNMNATNSTGSNATNSSATRVS